MPPGLRIVLRVHMPCFGSVSETTTQQELFDPTVAQRTFNTYLLTMSRGFKFVTLELTVGVDEGTTEP